MGPLEMLWKRRGKQVILCLQYLLILSVLSHLPVCSVLQPLRIQVTHELSTKTLCCLPVVVATENYL